MADQWRVTYMGDGVKSTSVGAFAKYTTAFVDEAFAKTVTGQEGWVVADPSGKESGSAPAPKAEKKAEDKKAEKPEKTEDKKSAEKAEKPAEKAEDKKAAEKAEKPAEKAAEKPAEKK